MISHSERTVTSAARQGHEKDHGSLERGPRSRLEIPHLLGASHAIYTYYSQAYTCSLALYNLPKSLGHTMDLLINRRLEFLVE